MSEEFEYRADKAFLCLTLIGSDKRRVLGCPQCGQLTPQHLDVEIRPFRPVWKSSGEEVVQRANAPSATRRPAAPRASQTAKSRGRCSGADSKPCSS